MQLTPQHIAQLSSRGGDWRQRVQRAILTPCKHCNMPPSLGLGVLRQSDGKFQVRFYCVSCPRPSYNGASWISDSLPDPYGLIESFNLWGSIKVDNVRWDRPCAKCGDRTSGVQEHHWAPRSIFGIEAWDWPTAYLCVRCHEEWHLRTGLADKYFRKAAA